MSTPEFTPTPPTPTLPACPVSVPAHLLALRTAKVRDHHLDRKAIVYIRQSSPQQVAEHKESTARQYALADRGRCARLAPGAGRCRAGEGSAWWRHLAGRFRFKRQCCRR